MILIKCGTPGIYFRTADKEQLIKIGGGIGEEIADSWSDQEAFEKVIWLKKIKSLPEQVQEIQQSQLS